MTRLIAAIFLLVLCDHANAGAADTIAHDIRQAFSSPDRLSALFDLQARWGAAGKDRPSVDTFADTRSPQSRRALRAAVLSGSCDRVRTLELDGFLARFPDFRADAIDILSRMDLARTVAGTSRSYQICMSNLLVTEILRALPPSSRDNLPLSLNSSFTLYVTKQGTGIEDEQVLELTVILYHLESEAMCRDNPMAIRALTQYMSEPRLVVYPPAQTAYLRSRAQALDVGAIQPRPPKARGVDEPVATAPRDAAAPGHEFDGLIMWEMRCNDPVFRDP